MKTAVASASNASSGIRSCGVSRGAAVSCVLRIVVPTFLVGSGPLGVPGGLDETIVAAGASGPLMVR
ncbi:hypothetical protein GCM10023317_59700 [Actinopolymorpha pittospori]